jgi:diguanylate cyclase (GGDEF)-like protein
MAVTIAIWALAEQLRVHLPARPSTDEKIDMLTLVGLIYLIGFVGLSGALLRLRRSPGNGLAPAGLLDTMTVTLVLFLLIWVLVIRPDGPGWWSLVDPSLVAYLIGDALIFASATRLAIVGPASPATLALIGAAGARLVSDLVHSLASPGLVDPLWTIAAVAEGLAAASLGWAALHPSMVGLTESEAEPVGRLSLRRFWVVAMTALVAPIVLLVQAATGTVRDGVVIAVLGAALTLVALARVAATGESQSRSLARRARTDTLTGLADRAQFMRRLTAAGEPPWSAVLLVDLDQFRQLNHDEGPSVGDQVLVTLAGRLRRLVGGDDVVARVGGDEFGILLGSRAQDVTTLVTEVVAATSTPVAIGPRPVAVSACVGVAVTPEPPPGSDHSAAADLGEEMLRRAGLALGAAKEAGRGEWCRYDAEQDGPMIERTRLRESLHRAVGFEPDDGAFFLSYQPIVALATGATVGFEALVRWEHPTRGLILPSEFIAVAEETGLIEAIGGLVLRTAATEAAGWPNTNVYVSVNVSPRQLRRPGFAERVEEALASSGLSAHRLMLELTESVVTKGSDHVWAELALLRELGVRLALDDFGTGFSSLSYLEQTPIGVIKMDKSFVDSLVPSDRQRRVVAGILSMATDIGLQVVAEGIETTAERDLLADLGCPYGQGYLYSRPLTATEVVAWLAGDAGDSREEHHADASR